jgi:hypothetical protein
VSRCRAAVGTAGLCLALLIVAKPAHSGPGGDAVEASSVYVDALLADPSTRRIGPAPIATRAVVLGGHAYRHGIVMSVDASEPGRGTAAVNVRLGRAYARFRATIGRDDSESENGPAPAYFEVWGDGSLLLRSAALAPAAGVTGGSKVRRMPMEIDLPVSGFATLRLTVRYAASAVDPSQSKFARGCAWALPRLIPRGALPVDPADIRRDAASDFRSLARGAAARLGAAAVQAGAALATPVAPPFKAMVGVVADAPAALPPALERAVLAELIAQVRSANGAPVFDLKENRGRRGRRSRPEDGGETAQRDEARRAGAEWLIEVGFTPATDRPGEGVLALKLVAVQDGSALVAVDAASPESPKTP